MRQRKSHRARFSIRRAITCSLIPDNGVEFVNPRFLSNFDLTFTVYYGYRVIQYVSCFFFFIKQKLFGKSPCLVETTNNLKPTSVYIVGTWRKGKGWTGRGLVLRPYFREIRAKIRDKNTWPAHTFYMTYSSHDTKTKNWPVPMRVIIKNIVSGCFDGF